MSTGKTLVEVNFVATNPFYVEDNGWEPLRCSYGKQTPRFFDFIKNVYENLLVCYQMNEFLCGLLGATISSSYFCGDCGNYKLFLLYFKTKLQEDIMPFVRSVDMIYKRDGNTDNLKIHNGFELLFKNKSNIFNVFLEIEKYFGTLDTFQEGGRWGEFFDEFFNSKARGLVPAEILMKIIYLQSYVHTLTLFFQKAKKLDVAKHVHLEFEQYKKECFFLGRLKRDLPPEIKKAILLPK